MIHHAARLNAALPSPFQSILRDAAARAFSRTQLSAQPTRGVATLLAQASTSTTPVDVDARRMLARKREGLTRRAGKAVEISGGSANQSEPLGRPARDSADVAPAHVAGRRSGLRDNVQDPPFSPAPGSPSAGSLVRVKRQLSRSRRISATPAQPTAKSHTSKGWDTSVQRRKSQSTPSSRPREHGILPNASSALRLGRPQLGFGSRQRFRIPDPPEHFIYSSDPARFIEYPPNPLPLEDLPWPNTGSASPAPRVISYDVHLPKTLKAPPRNQHDFLLLLKQYKVSQPRPSLRSILHLHDSFPTYQSTATWNLIIATAIRHGAFNRAATLLDEMGEHGYRADTETWRLHTRLLVRRGSWSEAVQQIARAQADWMNAPVILRRPGVPAAVWTEILLGMNPGHARRTKHAREKRDEGPDSRVRYDMLMRLRHQVDPASDNGPSAGVAFTIVQLFHRMGEHAVARKVAFALAPSYDPSIAIRIVNANLALRPRVGTRSFFNALKDLHQLLSMCPELRPTGKTLFALLGHLKGAKNRGERAFEVAKQFVRRWGHRVIGRDVRQRLVALSRDKGADQLSVLVKTLSPARRRWVLSQWTRTKPVTFVSRGQVYPRRCTRGWVWRRARRKRWFDRRSNAFWYMLRTRTRGMRRRRQGRLRTRFDAEHAKRDVDRRSRGNKSMA
ncbi:hypothetical protein PENSPDRAFT_3418 [Peniophora sp. CONT]|nr:hypothetical protein PENSPDRAFT_3418 [Peniophora sp. CONT]